MSRVKKKERILIINYEFPPLGGGGGVAAKKLAKGFIENGCKVDYLTTWFKGLKKYEKINGINVYRVRVFGRNKLPTASMISLYSFPLLSLLKGIKLCKENNYKFINSHFVVPSGVLGYVLSKIFKLRHVLSLIGGDIYDPTKKNSPHKKWYYRYLVKKIIEEADSVTAISANTLKNAKKFYGVKRDIIITSIPYEVIDFKKISRKALGLKNDVKYLIGIGRLVERKGFDFFIEVLAKLPENVFGIILGDGPEKNNLKNFAKKIKVEDRLLMPGFVSEEKKMQYLSNSDLFFLSSRHEGFGIVLQEAMQVGLFIVATDDGGQIDLLNKGNNYIFLKFGDVSSAVKIISDFLKNNKKTIIKNKNINIKNIVDKYTSN